MLHEEICTYEVCKLAKEKGFPQKASRWRKSTSPSRNYYNHKGELNGDCLEIIKCICRKEEVPIELQTIAAPTQSLLQRWLREEKGIHIIIDGGFQWGVEDLQRHFMDRDIQVEIGAFGLFDTYEEALHDALLYALQNV